MLWGARFTSLPTPPFHGMSDHQDSWVVVWYDSAGHGHDATTILAVDRHAALEFAKERWPGHTVTAERVSQSPFPCCLGVGAHRPACRHYSSKEQRMIAPFNEFVDETRRQHGRL